MLDDFVDSGVATKEKITLVAFKGTHAGKGTLLGSRRVHIWLGWRRWRGMGSSSHLFRHSAPVIDPAGDCAPFAGRFVK
ncbi:MAG TPA: hypothetical protein DCQ06_03645 [Myxococcales bacterium]|nr:hypothetical protein [Myxococcales bacterium]